jgi:hypothetical protein
MDQHLSGNHINKSPVGFTPPSADQFPSASQTPPMYNQTPNGTNHQPTSQQNFNGTNMSSNGPIVHEYNHGFNNADQPIQKHFHTQDQRKKSKKFKRKHYNSCFSYIWTRIQVKNENEPRTIYTKLERHF